MSRLSRSIPRSVYGSFIFDLDSWNSRCRVATVNLSYIDVVYLQSAKITNVLNRCERFLCSCKITMPREGGLCDDASSLLQSENKETLHRMAGYYRIFRPFNRIICDLNQSADLIQMERFENQIQKSRRERTHADKYKLLKSDPIDTTGELQRFTLSDAIRNIWRDVDWMIEYNKNTYLQFWICCFYVVFIIMMIVPCVLYGFLPNERDSTTGLRIDPTLRFLESVCLLDLMKNFEQSILFNRVFAIFFIQFVIVRLRHFKRRFDSARANRNEYKSINIVQLQLGTADNFTYSMSDIRWLLSAWSHECDMESTEARERHSNMREQTRRLKVVDQAEKYYYCNQIDFELCYKGRTGVYKQKDKKAPSKFWIKRTLDDFFDQIALGQPNRTSFFSKPKNRIDPPHMMMVLVSYLSTIVGFTILLLMSIVAALYPDFVASGLDPSNMSGTCWMALKRYVARRELLVFAFATVVIQLLCAMNALDNGLLLFNTMMCLSRSTRVTKLIDREVQWYRKQMRHLNRMLLDYEESDLVVASRTREFEIRRGVVSWSTDTDEPYQVDVAATRLEAVRSNFRKSLDPDQEREFNDNVDYIVDLIGVLVREFSDMKKIVTLDLNLNIIFGTCCSSIIFLAMSRIQNPWNYIIWLVLLTVIDLPLLISLVLGATGEGSFRNIYKRLSPLLHDVLNLIDPKVQSNLLKVGQHLVKTENRSFMVLGNLALTFGSMTSILGWIASGNLLLQRFAEQQISQP